MSQRLSTSVGGATTNQRSIAASAGMGVIAAAVGYLVSYLLIANEARETFENVAEWKAVAWYYYEAHLVDIVASGQVEGIAGGSRTLELIAESSGSNAALLYVIPPLALVLAGAVLAYNLRTTDLGSAVVAGAPVAIGYAVVMGLGTVVTEASSQGSFFGVEATGSIAPDLLPALVLGGLLYPLVFATVGAVATSLAIAR